MRPAGDRYRCGVVAALLGTLDRLEPVDRALQQGLIVNKFRGGATLFQSGVDFLVQRSGVSVLGVVVNGVRPTEAAYESYHYQRNNHYADTGAPTGGGGAPSTDDELPS